MYGRRRLFYFFSGTASLFVGCHYHDSEIFDGGRRRQRREARLQSQLSSSSSSLSSCFPTAAVEPVSLINWAGTHSSNVQLLEPEYTEDLEQLVHQYHECGQPIRVIGSVLSPNGCGLADPGHVNVSLARCDRVLHVDEDRLQVRVEAGITVAALTERLARHGMALQNYASIDSQQVGGFTQTGAHGSGPSIPPVDAQVMAMRLVTPAFGPLELSVDTAPRLFRCARVAVGSLGVVTELTLQCVPAHSLVERLHVVHDRDLTPAVHRSLLQSNRHVKYLWMPQMDQIVVATSNPAVDAATAASLAKCDCAIRDQQHQLVQAAVAADQRNSPLADEIARASRAAAAAAREHKRKDWQNTAARPEHAVANESVVPAHDRGDSVTEEQRPTQALLDLYASLSGPVHGGATAVSNFSFAELRDLLLAMAPLDAAHVRRVTGAETEFWRKHAAHVNAAGTPIPSSKLLQFDCGGQQLVSEVCFPVTGTDSEAPELEFVRQLIRQSRLHDWPMHGPIELRWTAGSASLLSLASISVPSKPSSSSSSSSSSTSSSSSSSTSSSTSSTLSLSSSLSSSSLSLNTNIFNEQQQIFGWVGIIHYLPTHNDRERQLIVDSFARIRAMTAAQLWTRFGAVEHWAKLEPDSNRPLPAAHRGATAGENTDASSSVGTRVSAETGLSERLTARFGDQALRRFAEVHRLLDPKKILLSSRVQSILPFLTDD